MRMKELKLSDFLALPEWTQEKVAKMLSVTQGAIHQMLKAERDIRIVVDDAGTIVNAYEQRPIGKFKSAPQEAA